MSKISMNYFFFYTYCMIEARFNRLDFRLSQKAGPYDAFLNYVCFR